MFDPQQDSATHPNSAARPKATVSLTVLVRNGAIADATLRRHQVDRAAVTGALLAGAALSHTLARSRKSGVQGSTDHVKLRF